MEKETIVWLMFPQEGALWVGFSRFLVTEEAQAHGASSTLF